MTPPSTQRTLCLAALLVCTLPGCSLLTIEFPDEPLTEPELNARISTHQFVNDFSVAVREAADQIADAATSDARRIQTLRWKIGAMNSVRTAAFHISPRDALVDTWTYCVQMASFFESGKGSSLFGSLQPIAVESSGRLRDQITGRARIFVNATDFERISGFVESYSVEHPLEDILAPRDSVVGALHEFLQISPEHAIATVGTLPQVVSDFGTRMAMLGEDIGEQATWRSQLLLYETGLDQLSLQAELDRFGARLERLTGLAEQSPEVLDTALTRLSEELAVLIEAIDVQRLQTLSAISHERELLTAAIVQERAATMNELQDFSDHVIENAWTELRAIIDSVLIGAVAFVVVLFGAPFGLGLLVGRVTKRASRVASTRP